MGSRTTDTRTVLVLAGAWSSPAPEAAPSWRSVVGTIAVPAGRRGDFWLRFHDSPASGVVVRGRSACQRLPKPARSPNGRVLTHRPLAEAQHATAGAAAVHDVERPSPERTRPVRAPSARSRLGFRT